MGERRGLCFVGYFWGNHSLSQRCSDALPALETIEEELKKTRRLSCLAILFLRVRS